MAWLTSCSRSQDRLPNERRRDGQGDNLIGSQLTHGSASLLFETVHVRGFSTITAFAEVRPTASLRQLIDDLHADGRTLGLPADAWERQLALRQRFAGLRSTRRGVIAATSIPSWRRAGADDGSRPFTSDRSAP